MSRRISVEAPSSLMFLARVEMKMEPDITSRPVIRPGNSDHSNMYNTVTCIYILMINKVILANVKHIRLYNIYV